MVTTFDDSLEEVAKTRRPHTLKEAVEWGCAFGNKGAFLREFLDHFYASDQSLKEHMLIEMPPLTPDVKNNAYIAAVAEHLALKNHLKVPQWSGHKDRFLHKPYFPCGLESLKATLIKESPVSFRRRLIFVGSDVLSRPHSH